MSIAAGCSGDRVLASIDILGEIPGGASEFGYIKSGLYRSLLDRLQTGGGRVLNCMDSINRNQQEQNHEDLTRSKAVDKIKAVVKKAQSCFFCTAVKIEGSTGARPMSVQKVDDEGNLWFLSADDSHKNLELVEDPSVTLYFQGSPHSDFLVLHGTATVSRDKAKIKELWEFVNKTWFTEGVDDPRITVIKVAPRDGYYWDTKHGNAVAGVKMIVGAALGRTMDDSIEGRLSV